MYRPRRAGSYTGRFGGNGRSSGTKPGGVVGALSKGLEQTVVEDAHSVVSSVPFSPFPF